MQRALAFWRLICNLRAFAVLSYSCGSKNLALQTSNLARISTTKALELQMLSNGVVEQSHAPPNHTSPVFSVLRQETSPAIRRSAPYHYTCARRRMDCAANPGL